MDTPIHLAKEKPIPTVDYGPLPYGLTHREQAEEETARDLEKPFQQLLADAQDELLHTDRTESQNLHHAQKRIVSLQARAAITTQESAMKLIELTDSIEKSHQQLLRLTSSLNNLTIAIVVFTVLLFGIEVIRWAVGK